MITNVLVPTDFSDEALKALPYAAAPVLRCRAHLHVVNVSEIDFAVPPSAGFETNPSLADTEETRALRQQVEGIIGKNVAVASSLPAN